MKSRRLVFLCALIGLGAMSRLLPHPDNFTPILAIALFGGATLPSLRTAIGIPIGIMLATDAVVILAEVIPRSGLSLLWQIVFVDLVVYFCMALIAGIGIRLGRRCGIVSLILAAIGSCLMFFVLTNLANWMAFYDKSWRSLFDCYASAIPYLKNSVGSTILYAMALFGVWRFAELRCPMLVESSDSLSAFQSV